MSATVRKRKIPLGYAKRTKPFKVTKATVKRLMLNEMETKHYIIAPSRSLISGSQYWTNLWYYQTQGTGYTQRVGTAIHLESIDLVGYFIRNQGVTSNGVRCYMAIVDCDVEARDGTLGPDLSLSLLPDARAGAVGDTTNPIWDSNTFKLVHEMQFYIPGANSSIANEFGSLKHHIPINRKFTFKGDSSGYPKENNLFLYVSVTDGTSSAGVGAFYTQIRMNFKDA
jgi:hypothetical protein